MEGPFVPRINARKTEFFRCRIRAAVTKEQSQLETTMGFWTRDVSQKTVVSDPIRFLELYYISPQ